MVVGRADSAHRTTHGAPRMLQRTIRRSLNAIRRSAVSGDHERCSDIVIGSDVALRRLHLPGLSGRKLHMTALFDFAHSHSLWRRRVVDLAAVLSLAAAAACGGK